MLSAYCEVGLAIARLTGRGAVFDTAIAQMKEAEETIGDRDISRRIAQYERSFRLMQNDRDTDYLADDFLDD